MLEVDNSDSDQSNERGRQKAIQEFQQRLVLLHHASKCEYEDYGKGGRCRVTPHCKEMKSLWSHVNSCTVQDCSYMHCISTRFLLSHYNKCTDNPQCRICKPLKDSVTRIYKRTRSIIYVSPRRLESESDESPLTTPRDEHTLDDEGTIPSSKYIRAFSNVQLLKLSSRSPELLDNSLDALTRKMSFPTCPISPREKLSPLTSPRDALSSRDRVSLPTISETVEQSEVDEEPVVFTLPCLPVPAPVSAPPSSEQLKPPLAPPKVAVPLLPLKNMMKDTDEATLSSNSDDHSTTSSITANTTPYVDPPTSHKKGRESSDSTTSTVKDIHHSEFRCGKCQSGIERGYRYHCAVCALDFCSPCFHCQEDGEPHEHPIRAYLVDRR